VEKMNKFSLLLGLAVIAMAGCGKKCDKNKPVVEKHKKIALADVPLLKDETENLFDDNVSELAFVDEDFSLNTNQNNDFVASASLEVDRNDIAAQDSDHASAYAFKVVRFDFNKNDIRSDQHDVVAQDVMLAKTAVQEGKNVIVEGHTCQIGSASYNLALSQRRAESVKHEMIEQGIPAESIKTVGLGYEHPVVWSDAKSRPALIKALSPNRRAEVLVN
jgi:outer membrane protein OmpA-like peptidoglycan-associated protein